MLKRVLEGKENQIKELKEYFYETQSLLNKLEEDGVIEKYSDTDDDGFNQYYIEWYNYKNIFYKLIQDSK